MDKKSLSRLAIAGIMAGGFALTGCNETTGTKTETKTGIAGASTVAAFQSECAKLNGMFKAHDCKGLNECKGHSFAEGKEVASHDCKGLSSCMGGSCIES